MVSKGPIPACAKIPLYSACVLLNLGGHLGNQQRAVGCFSVFRERVFLVESLFCREKVSFAMAELCLRRITQGSLLEVKVLTQQQRVMTTLIVFCLRMFVRIRSATAS